MLVGSSQLCAQLVKVVVDAAAALLGPHAVLLLLIQFVLRLRDDVGTRLTDGLLVFGFTRYLTGFQTGVKTVLQSIVMRAVERIGTAQRCRSCQSHSSGFDPCGNAAVDHFYHH